MADNLPKYCCGFTALCEEYGGIENCPIAKRNKEIFESPNDKKMARHKQRKEDEKR